MKGYYKPFEPLKLRREVMTVCCKRCNSTWQEEVEHFGLIAGYAEWYDMCDKCITPAEKVQFDPQGGTP